MENKHLDDFASSFEQSLNRKAKELKHPYVVKYMHKGDLYGYHASTFCQVTNRKLEAKRYEGDPIEQIKTINDNLKYVLTNLDKGLHTIAREKYWKDVQFEDVFIDFEYLPEGIKSQTFKVTKL